jgi:hypothetical protein
MKARRWGIQGRGCSMKARGWSMKTRASDRARWLPRPRGSAIRPRDGRYGRYGALVKCTGAAAMPDMEPSSLAPESCMSKLTSPVVSRSTVHDVAEH